MLRLIKRHLCASTSKPIMRPRTVVFGRNPPMRLNIYPDPESHLRKIMLQEI